MGRVREQVLAATAGRDRVVDAVKSGALCLVILGHSLAWNVAPDGTAANTLEAVPAAAPLTWVVQTLPLFFLVAGFGLARVGTEPTAGRIARRIERLAAPALPLMAVTLALSLVADRVISPEAGVAAGLLPTQLLWFLGVYLMLVVASPVLVRLRSAWCLLAGLLAIATVDVLRVQVDETLGWLNLVLVWSLFAGAGMHLPALRELPRGLLVAVLASALVAAVALIRFGPYSSALVTTTATPGITNLAPPTVVLALAGTAQVCVLLLAWTPLERLLRGDALWVAVAVFSSRAMELYLWHMLGFTIAIGLVLGTGFAPDALSITWWLLRVVVLAMVVGIVWTAAPVLIRLTGAVAGVLNRVVPVSVAHRSLPVAMGLAFLASLTLLAVSESGMAEPLTPRIVIVLPYIPLVALVVLGLATGLAGQHRPTPSPGAG
jgi:hypothetical protein